MNDKPLYQVLEARYEQTLADHRHAVNMIANRDRKILDLTEKLVKANRQNRRLSKESRILVERLKQLNPDDEALLNILYREE